MFVLQVQLKKIQQREHIHILRKNDHSVELYFRIEDRLYLVEEVICHRICRIHLPLEFQPDNVDTSTHSLLHEMSVYSLSLPLEHVKVISFENSTSQIILQV